MKPYVCGKTRYATLEEACARAGLIFRRYGVVVAVEYRPTKPRKGGLL